MAQVFPEATVGIIIVNSDGKIFIAKSQKWKNKYVLPGGHVELGEELVDAVKREAKEETNLFVSDVKLIDFQEIIYPKTFFKKMHFLCFGFACRTKSSRVVLNDEAESFLWVYPRKSLGMNVEPYSKRIIADFLKKYSDGF
jgi:nucleoside triphosphatase